ncbi:unnamed protein product [Orchesella dallaii]|uniref:Uncharacterized protein n=1 Tax=Orchesella dallaii TaxID=48710 RepID=A0ABP1RWJ2_9HEXA
MATFKTKTSTSKRGSLKSHISPKFPVFLSIITVFFCSIIIQSNASQEYMSQCDKISNPCAVEGFLSCISNQCQCQDPLNQIYDDAMSQCVIMAGRNCNFNGEPSDDLVDPRTLPSFPNCGRNARCDSRTRTCQCKKGFILNGDNGTCDSSFGKPCYSEDSIVFSTGFGGDKNTTETTLGECDISLGLRCENGKCECEDQSIWQIGKGCVARSQMYFNGNSNITTTTSYSNEDMMTPFQLLVDTYTKALIEANNYYYFPQNHTEGNKGNNSENFNLMTVAYPDDLLYNLTWSMGMGGNRNKTDEYPVGDRSQFPSNNNNGGGPKTNNINPIWNLIAQPQQNNISNDNLAKLQVQAAQLQSLLSQQQRLQQLINQLNPSSTLNQVASSQPQQQQQNLQVPSPSPFAVPQGQGYYPAQSQIPYPNYYQPLLNSPQQAQQQPAIGGGPFPLLPRGTHALLPVLRAVDQQFTPILESIIQLTKPRPMPSTQAPSVFYNPLQQQWNGQFLPALQPQYQNQQGSLYGPQQQRQQQLQGRTLWSNNGRNGRTRNRNGNRNRDNSFNRNLWWW